VCLLLTLTSCARYDFDAPAPGLAQPTTHDFARWEKAIQAFEAAERANPSPQGAALFTGSSTITLWKNLAEDFPAVTVINRGFGGCQIEDCTYFAERYIFPVEPRFVVLAAGTNDIHTGKSPRRVYDDFVAFAEKIHAALPETQIVFVSLNPRISRWSERDACRAVNVLAKRYAFWRPWIDYVETYDMPLGEDGQPRPELFVPDNLHFSDAGNRLLAERIGPYLQ
jgi:hypothetical protein